MDNNHYVDPYLLLNVIVICLIMTFFVTIVTIIVRFFCNIYSKKKKNNKLNKIIDSYFNYIKNKNYNNINNECPICFDNINNSDSIVLECNHQFHNNCLKNLIIHNCKNEYNNIFNCPICRKEYNLDIRRCEL